MSFNLVRRGALAIVALSLAGGAMAQTEWPARTVTVIVPSSPGGGTDAYGRILAQALTEQLKQTFVVDNKPGASGAIGAAAAAQAHPTATRCWWRRTRRWASTPASTRRCNTTSGATSRR